MVRQVSLLSLVGVGAACVPTLQRPPPEIHLDGDCDEIDRRLAAHLTGPCQTILAASPPAWDLPTAGAAQSYDAFLDEICHESCYFAVSGLVDAFLARGCMKEAFDSLPPHDKSEAGRLAVFLVFLQTACTRTAEGAYCTTAQLAAQAGGAAAPPSCEDLTPFRCCVAELNAATDAAVRDIPAQYHLTFMHASAALGAPAAVAARCPGVDFGTRCPVAVVSDEMTSDAEENSESAVSGTSDLLSALLALLLLAGA